MKGFPNIPLQTTVQLTLTPPHPAQAKIFQEAKRFNVLSCGRRFGKTTMGMDRLIHPALAGKPVAWFSPTYKQLSEAWRNFETTLSPIITRKQASEHRLELRSGGTIEAWSLENPDSGRGRAYAAVVIDEAAMVAKLQSAWQESIRPMLTDYRGDAWFLSTPKGTANYFHTLFQRGVDQRTGGPASKGEWRSWRLPTSSNPFIVAEEIEAAKDDLSDLAFSQEYLAQFVSWEGAVFRKITDAVDDKLPLTKGKAAAIGVDWGRTNDYTVFVAMDEALSVIGMDRFRGIEYSLQRGRLQAFSERFGNPVIYAESNSIGGPVIEQLQKDDIKVKPFLTTNASKAEAVEGLALSFERSLIHIPNDPVLIGELQAFEGNKLPSGLIRYEAPDNGHDDTVIALAICHFAIVGRRGRVNKDFIRQMMEANNAMSGNPNKIDNGRLQPENI